ISFLPFPQFLLIFFFSHSSSLNPSQHLAHATMISLFFVPKMASNCCSPLPLLNPSIRFLEKFPKSHKNGINCNTPNFGLGFEQGNK
ncbi:hypothetical protein ES319_D07G146900v1, partial [Gossypium barbadense]